MDEHQVDIGGVVEFMPAELSQRDDGESLVRAMHLDGHAHAGFGEVGDLLDGFGHGCVAQQVPRADS